MVMEIEIEKSKEWAEKISSSLEEMQRARYEELSEIRFGHPYDDTSRNYVKNELKVTGPEEHLSEFVGFVEEEFWCFDFSNIIPYPEEFLVKDLLSQEREVLFERELFVFVTEHPDRKLSESYAAVRDRLPRIDDGYNHGGSQWRTQNWGTKWNACESRMMFDSNEKAVHYKFNTAWSPPYFVILEASKKFPKLRFSLQFWESAIGFTGTYVVENGEEWVQSIKKYKEYEAERFIPE